MALYGDEKRAYESERRRLATREANEVGVIPPCVDWAKRVELLDRPAEWLRLLLPEFFFTEFTPAQLRLIDLEWDAIKNGATQNVQAYRGIGKTSIGYGLQLKAILDGISKHTIIVTAEGGNSTEQASDWFRAALEDDWEAEFDDLRLISRFYPEVALPLQKRAGRAQRPVTHCGKPCEIAIKSDRIEFPRVYRWNGERGSDADDVSPSPSCGALIRFTSIGSGSIRGSNRAIPGLGSFRVRCVALDDVQSDITASSQVEVKSIVTTIEKSLKSLSGKTSSGRREPLAIVSAITQNQPDDVACKLAENVDFATVTIPFCTELPDNFIEWSRYKSFRENVLRRVKSPADRAAARAELTAYFREHETELAKNVTVDDARIYESWQASAVHYAIDYWCSSERAFWCELQNDAYRAVAETSDGLAPVDVIRKRRVNSSSVELQRCWVPNEADVLTAFIDVGEHYLNYEITAFKNDFSFAHVVDFGVWPEQTEPTTSKHRYSVDLQSVYRFGDKMESLANATFDLLRYLFEQQYFSEDGEPISVDDATDFVQNAKPRGASARRNFCRFAVCGVDCSDGEMEIALWNAIEAFHKSSGGKWLGRAIPCYGVKAGARLVRYYDLKPGEWRRRRFRASTCDWIENPKRSETLKRSYSNVYASFLYDANTAKTRSRIAWETRAGRVGAATVFSGGEPATLAMFAQQQCAESYKISNRSGLEYRVWEMRRPRLWDNEFLDTDAGCRALAEYVGCEARSDLDYGERSREI